MDHALLRPAGRRRPGPIARIRAALVHRRHSLRLRDLSAHLLDDIGISRDRAEDEASRPIWDVPHNWRS